VNIPGFWTFIAVKTFQTSEKARITRLRNFHVGENFEAFNVAKIKRHEKIYGADTMQSGASLSPLQRTTVVTPAGHKLTYPKHKDNVPDTRTAVPNYRQHSVFRAP
jgi:hypothetical protein